MRQLAGLFDCIDDWQIQNFWHLEERGEHPNPKKIDSPKSEREECYRSKSSRCPEG